MADTLAESVRELVAELEARFPYAAALLTGATGTQITDDGREQSASEVDPSRGIVFTVYDGSAFAEYSTSDLTPEHLAAGVRGWAGELSPRPGGPPLAGERDALPTTSEPRVFGVAMEVDPAAVPLPDKLALLRDVQQRAQALDTRIVQARIGYTDNTYESTYIGRGRFLEQHVTRTRLFLVIAVSDGGQVRYDYLNRGGTVGFELTRISDGDLARTVETAVRLLTAERIEPDEYDIVADNAISGVIAHESFGHGVELDLYPKGRARSAHYLDQQVAAAGLNMYDDPSVAGGYGSYFFDDEGELARSTQILRDGVFVRPISDFASATFAPGIHTPNGRRQDFTRKVYARMSNTFFGPGDTPPEAVIGGVERGIYLRQVESGMEDPMGWGIQVCAHYGEEIRNGQLTGRLFAPITMTGYVPDVLRSISAIGSDFALDPGFCGKGHKEMVPVSSGGPHLRTRARLG